MQKMFYGKPPASIEAWIIENFIPGPVPGPAPTTEPEPIPVAPNGVVLYKTAADGEWLEDNADISADISNGTFNGFANKSNAVEVIIPDKDINGKSVTSIGDRVFYNCTSLTSMTIPNSVTSIGMNAFTWCSGLKSVTIPDSMTNIGAFAFSGCSGLTSMTIGNSVTSIGYDAFSGCTRLTTMTIPDSVTTIGERAVAWCTRLTSVTFDGNAPTVDANTFFNVASGCKAIVDPTKTGWPAEGELWNGLVVEYKTVS